MGAWGGGARGEDGERRRVEKEGAVPTLAWLGPTRKALISAVAASLPSINSQVQDVVAL